MTALGLIRRHTPSRAVDDGAASGRVPDAASPWSRPCFGAREERDHRRRGLLRAMMRALLDACHQGGEPVAYLWATEDTIYGRLASAWHRSQPRSICRANERRFTRRWPPAGTSASSRPVLPRNTCPRSTNAWPSATPGMFASEARLGGRT